MAGKKQKPADDGVFDEAPATAIEETPSTGPPVRPVSDYCCIVNLTSRQRDFDLTNGRTAHTGPKLPGRSINRSKPFLRKFIGPSIRDLEREGLIEIAPATEQEVAS